MSKYWKIVLTAHNTPLGTATFATCEEADTLDVAIAQAREGVGPAFTSAAGQQFSAAEYAKPKAAEAVFLESGGDFNAYLKGL